MMKKQLKNKFLALTAFEDFWDTSKDIVFLGKWCLRYSKKKNWEKLKFDVIYNEFEDIKKYIGSYNCSNEVLDFIIDQYALKLNKLHGINQSKKFWRIIIGPWLAFYIPTVFERYLSIKNALKKYPDITINILDKGDHIIPKDTYSFFSIIGDDLYNLQLYTQILNIIGTKKNLITKSLNKKKAIKSTTPFYTRGSLIDSFIKKTINILIKLISKKNNVVLYNSYFSNKSNSILFKFLIKTSCKAIPFYTPYFDYPDFLPDQNLRKKLYIDKKQNKSIDEFKQLLLKLIPLSIPIIFVEGFFIKDIILKKLFTIRPKNILSSNAWWYDEIFKIWAADCSEKKTRLLITQHGGNYGSSLTHDSENFEKSISDIYYTWGWNEKNNDKIKPMPAAKLINQSIRIKKNIPGKILYVLTSHPRYFRGFYNRVNVYFDEYLHWQQKFIYSLNEKNRNLLRVRLYYINYGWDIENRIKGYKYKIKIEDNKIPFITSLTNSSLYICDHLSTTFLEALSNNIPTILFWDPKREPLRQDAKRYYKKLHDAEILFYNPQKAGEKINEISGQINNWWRDPNRQSVIKEFCNKYARRSKNEFMEWVNEFKRLSK